jgi:hypothetical protein
VAGVQDREGSFEESGKGSKRKNPGPKKGMKRMRQLLRQVFSRAPLPNSK